MTDTNSNVAVLKINTALSNKPFFVKITDINMSVDRIFAEAISNLINTGRPLESQQLEQLYKQHQLFNFGKVIQKGDLFSDLERKAQQVGDQVVQVAELDLITSHTGGGVIVTTQYICDHCGEECKTDYLMVSEQVYHITLNFDGCYTKNPIYSPKDAIFCDVYCKRDWEMAQWDKFQDEQKK